MVQCINDRYLSQPWFSLWTTATVVLSGDPVLTSDLEKTNDVHLKDARGVTSCIPNPCVYGICEPKGDSYKCICDAGWKRKNCNCNIDSCKPNPCKNGGTCTDKPNGYKCSCRQGYKGKNCQTDVGNCKPNPCENGGTCTEKPNGYKCACRDGYKGKDCEKVKRSLIFVTVFFAHPRGGWGIVLTNSMSEKKGTTTATTDEVSAKAKKTNRKDTTKESATASTSNENIMLAVLKSIQENQNALVQRMDSMESQLNDYGYQDELEGYDANQEVAPMEMELSELDSKAEGQPFCLSKQEV
ncbi:hypothetical protein ScPMuIL_015618 [Solemya velum]